MTKKPKQLSSTMQIAVTASMLNDNVRTAELEQIAADKRARKLPLAPHLEAAVK